MKEEIFSVQERLRILIKTKEIYVKQYAICLLNNQKRISEYYEPLGLCACFGRAFYYETGVSIASYDSIEAVIPEWDRSLAYQVSPLGKLSSSVCLSLAYGYWYPIWDKVSRVNFLNWLIDGYTKISTKVY